MRSLIILLQIVLLLTQLIFIFSDKERYKRQRLFRILPSGSDGKESACKAGDQSSIPGSGRFCGEGNGYLLQYSCLENPRDRGVWRATGHGITKRQTRLIQFLETPTQMQVNT